MAPQPVSKLVRAITPLGPFVLYTGATVLPPQLGIRELPQELADLCAILGAREFYLVAKPRAKTISETCPGCGAPRLPEEERGNHKVGKRSNAVRQELNVNDAFVMQHYNLSARDVSEYHKIGYTTFTRARRVVEQSLRLRELIDAAEVEAAEQAVKVDKPRKKRIRKPRQPGDTATKRRKQVAPMPSDVA